MESAACLIEISEDHKLLGILPNDTRFIRRPTEDEDEEWGRTCKQCPVAMQCIEWADRTEASGIYIAGEWRE